MKASPKTTLRSRVNQHRLTVSMLLAWTTKGLSAISDQGLFTLSNFAVNVLLARWLTPEGYGAFSLAFAIFLLMGTLHTGLLIDPMLVFGSGRHHDTLREYFKVVVQGHWLVSFAIGTTCGIVALILWATGTSLVMQSMLGLAIASPFILLQWLTRRACYVIRKPQYAAYAGALYMCIVFGVIYILYTTSQLNAFTALSAMGLASFASALWLLRRLRLGIFSRPRLNARSGQILRDHWSYGKWSASSHLLRSIPFQVYYLLLAVWAGLEATGTMKANMNLVLPILHGFSALGVLLVPALVRRRATNDFQPLVLFGSGVFALLALLYWVILGLSHDALLGLLYGGGQYTGHAALGWTLGLVAVGVGPQPILSAALQALERPDQAFRAHVAAAAISLTLGLGLMATFGVLGAILGLAASNATATIVTGWLLYRLK